MSAMNIFGLVVAGGQSRRMGDADKLWLELGGEALVARAGRRLSKQTGGIAININHSFEMNDFEAIPDVIGRYAGPLAGVLSGLEYVSEKYPDMNHIASVPADAPFFPLDLVQRLSSSLNDNEIVVPYVGGFTQQLFTLWPVSCASELRCFLESGENPKVMSFIRSQNWRKVEFPDDYAEQFLNVNTPEDWECAKVVFEKGTYE